MMVKTYLKPSQDVWVFVEPIFGPCWDRLSFRQQTGTLRDIKHLNMNSFTAVCWCNNPDPPWDSVTFHLISCHQLHPSTLYSICPSARLTSHHPPRPTPLYAQTVLQMTLLSLEPSIHRPTGRELRLLINPACAELHNMKKKDFSFLYLCSVEG